MRARPVRPRAVFDCNVQLSAVAFEDGTSAAAFRLVETGAVELFVSKPTLAELRRVLEYPEVLAISANLTPVRIAAFLERLTFRATLLRRVHRVFHFSRDPKDEAYLDLAAGAQADYLVTRDNDMLSLMSGHSVFCKEFRQKTHPLKVLSPAAFLAAVRR